MRSARLVPLVLAALFGACAIRQPPDVPPPAPESNAQDAPFGVVPPAPPGPAVSTSPSALASAAPPSAGSGAPKVPPAVEPASPPEPAPPALAQQSPTAAEQAMPAPPPPPPPAPPPVAMATAQAIVPTKALPPAPKGEKVERRKDGTCWWTPPYNCPPKAQCKPKPPATQVRCL